MSMGSSRAWHAGYQSTGLMMTLMLLHGPPRVSSAAVSTLLFQTLRVHAHASVIHLAGRPALTLCSSLHPHSLSPGSEPGSSCSLLAPKVQM